MHNEMYRNSCKISEIWTSDKITRNNKTNKQTKKIFGETLTCVFEHFMLVQNIKVD